MQHKIQSLTVLVGVLGPLLFVGACQKKQAPPPPKPPTVTLTAQPTTVEKGKAVTLSWSSEHATDLDLQPGVGKVQEQGSKSVEPQDSTTYTITASGPGGKQSATAQVNVTAPPSRHHDHHRRSRSATKS
jgi:hypothetical protein